MDAAKAAAAAAAAKAASGPTVDQQVSALKAELAEANSTAEDLREALQVTQNEFANQLEQLSKLHEKELTERAEDHFTKSSAVQKSLEEEINLLRDQHRKEAAKLNEDLVSAREELARASVKTPPPHPPAAASVPKSPLSPGSVTSDDLEKLHHAHDSKLKQVEEGHKQELARFREELEKRDKDIRALAEEVESKKMEIQFMLQEKEEEEQL